MPHFLRLWRLDRLRAHRAWMLRLPELLPTRRHVVAVMVGISLAITAIATVLLVMLYSMALANQSAEEVDEWITSALVMLGIAGMLGGISPSSLVSAFDQKDTKLLVKAGLTARDLLLGRAWFTQMFTWLVILVGFHLSLCIARLMVNLAPFDLRIFAASLLVLGAGQASYFVSVALFRFIMRLPPVCVAPALTLTGIVSPLILVGALTAVSPTLRELAGASSDISGFLGSVKDHAAVEAVIGALGDPSKVILVLLVSFALVVGCVVMSRSTASFSTSVVARGIGTGHRWRVGRPFARTMLRASLDKDLRLMFRRGLPFWQMIEDIVALAPTLVLIVSAGYVAGGVDNEILPLLTTLVNAGIVVVTIAMCSEALVPLVSSDSDGALVRLFRSEQGAMRRYLSAKAATSAAVLAGLGFLAVCSIQVLAPWPGLSFLTAAVMASIAAAVEAVIVVVGTAKQPAIHQREFGTSEVEPSVRLAGGMGTAISVAFFSPLVLGMSLVPLSGQWQFFVALAGVLPLSMWSAKMLVRFSSREVKPVYRKASIVTTKLTGV